MQKVAIPKMISAIMIDHYTPIRIVKTWKQPDVLHVGE